MAKANLVPPDGGWGWMIIVAFALNAICTVPIAQSFGLLFRNICFDLGMSATDVSVIINVNAAFGMILGLANGPLLRHFGYRKVAVAGSLIYSFAIMITGLANSFTFFVISYGIFASAGTGLTMSAFSLAVNSYFCKNRGRAMGVAMTMMGLGPVLMPQLVSFLLWQYGVRGTTFILGATSLNGLVGAVLLQPIRWHLKEEEKPACNDDSKTLECSQEENGKETKNGPVSASCEDIRQAKRKRTVSMTMAGIDHDVDVGNMFVFETAMPRKKSTALATQAQAPNPPFERSVSENGPPTTPRPIAIGTEPAYRWWSSGKSLDTINLGSSMKIFEQNLYQPAEGIINPRLSEDGYDGGKAAEARALVRKNKVQTVEEEEDETEEAKEEEAERKERNAEKASILRRVFRSTVFYFDLDILRDPIYVNMMLGISIALFAEINFSLLTPFILNDMDFDTEQTAMIMSTLAMVDLCSRCAAPYIGELLKQPPRVMYLLSLAVLIVGRTLLPFANSYGAVIAIAVVLGMVKGIRAVYTALCIPSYVPIEKLAAAFGIQMMTNGILFMSFGPVLGAIRDAYGSYDLCIAFINAASALTIIMWTIEAVVVRTKKRRSRFHDVGAA